MTSLELQVCEAYSQIAREPRDNPYFPAGRLLAEGLGYSEALLDSIPLASVEAFCGVADVSLFAEMDEQTVVLDFGCGAGLDSIVAARRGAQVIGVDFSLEMLNRAQGAILTAGLATKITLLKADAQSLPLLDQSVDVALINGIFNLNPDRRSIFAELARVIRPGESVYAAEIILTEPLHDGAAANAANWFT